MMIDGWTANDLISREALKEAFEETKDEYFGLYQAIKAVDNAPTVDLKDIYQEGYYDGHLEGYTKAINEERPTGEWIICNQDNEGIHKIECPFCKYVCGSDFGDQITMTFQKLPNYCENCGAKMYKKEA